MIEEGGSHAKFAYQPFYPLGMAELYCKAEG